MHMYLIAADISPPSLSLSVCFLFYNTFEHGNAVINDITLLTKKNQAKLSYNYYIDVQIIYIFIFLYIYIYSSHNQRYAYRTPPLPPRLKIDTP